MKKEWIALGILGLLFAGVLCNARYVQHHIRAIERQVQASGSHLLAGESEAASDALARAWDAWQDEDLYVSVFIRHAEVDGTTDAFLDALGVLDSDNRDAQNAVFQKLLEHLHNIVKMEQLSLGTVF